MLRNLRQPGVLLGVIAIVLACAGSATAGSLITGKKIKDGSITGRDVRNYSLTSKDIKRGGVARAAIADSTAAELQATLATTKVSRSEPIVATQGGWTPETVDASCPAGQVALGGGGGFASQSPWATLSVNRPVVDEATGNATGWLIGGRPQTTNGNDRLEVYVICAPAP